MFCALRTLRAHTEVSCFDKHRQLLMVSTCGSCNHLAIVMQSGIGIFTSSAHVAAVVAPQMEGSQADHRQRRATHEFGRIYVRTLHHHRPATSSLAQHHLCFSLHQPGRYVTNCGLVPLKNCSALCPAAFMLDKYRQLHMVTWAASVAAAVISMCDAIRQRSSTHKLWK